MDGWAFGAALTHLAAFATTPLGKQSDDAQSAWNEGRSMDHILEH